MLKAVASIDKAPAVLRYETSNPLRSRFSHAARQTFWPLVDQGAVSLGNFLTLVLVARALPDKAEYGAFGLVLEIIFYLNTIQSALVVYPLTVKGAIADDLQLRKMATAALLLTLVVALPAGLIGLGVAVLGRFATLGLAAAFALITWQLQEVVRRALIAHFRYLRAAWGDAFRYLGTAGCVWLMMHTHTLSLSSVFLVIGSFSTIAMQAVQIGLRPIGLPDLRAMATDFFHSGRWMMLTSITALVVSLCGVWTISAFHGNAVVGEYYAIANFTKPVNPLIATFCGLVVQYSAKAMNTGGLPAARQVALKLGRIACVLTLPYLIALALFPNLGMRAFYGRNNHFQVAEGELALRVFAISFMLMLFMTLTGAFMNGIHRTRENFFAQLVSCIGTVTIAFPLTIRFGLLGLVIGSTIASAIQFASMIYFLRRANRLEKHGECPG